MAINLVLLSLDGVSQSLFWHFREAMPALWSLSLRSVMFQRFFTSSTSAYQSLVDVLHGSSAELDHNLRYPSGHGCLRGKSENLFSWLRGKKYEVMGVQHGNSPSLYSEEGENLWGAWPRATGGFRRYGDYDGFYSATGGFLEKAKADRVPFALYFSDRAALPGDDSPEKSAARPYLESRFEKGFSLLDSSVSWLIDKLSSLDLLDNTVIVAYGPYGMDPWQHGIFHGRTKGTDPYASLCWTPFFIYSHGNEPRTLDRLISAIDLKATVQHVLFPGEPVAEPGDPLEGINIFAYQRGAAYTQNMFALEKEYRRNDPILAKSYAVTNGEFRLMVASDGAVPDEGGLELYFDQRDPENSRNFLDFFELNPLGDMVSFGHASIIHPHFTQSFKRPLVMGILKSYNTMKENLHEFIRYKEKVAAAFRGDSRGEQFPESSFTYKRKRK